jgi:putative transposase
VEHRVEVLGTRDQGAGILVGQRAQAGALRENSDGRKSCEGELKHPGLEHAPKGSTLSSANAHHPWKLFERLLYGLLAQCQAISPRKTFRFKDRLLTMDGTTAELCASRFD